MERTFEGEIEDGADHANRSGRLHREGEGAPVVTLRPIQDRMMGGSTEEKGPLSLMRLSLTSRGWVWRERRLLLLPDSGAGAAGQNRLNCPVAGTGGTNRSVLNFNRRWFIWSRAMAVSKRRPIIQA